MAGVVQVTVCEERERGRKLANRRRGEEAELVFLRERERETVNYE